MTDVNSKVGRSAATPCDANLPPQPVQGLFVEGSAPPVIINPAASADDLMGWAHSHLRALDGVLMPISCGNCDVEVDPQEIATSVRELLLPTLAVVDAAREASSRERVARNRAPAPSAAVKPDLQAIDDALNDAADAHHAIEACLDQLSDAAYANGGRFVVGFYEAAIASTERLDRALARGMEARGAR